MVIVYTAIPVRSDAHGDFFSLPKGEEEVPIIITASRHEGGLDAYLQARVSFVQGGLLDGFAALLHEPFGCGGGSADADALCTVEPAGIDVGGGLDEMGAGIDATAFGKEDSAVAALAACHEEYDVVTTGKVADIGDAVGYLTTDGVVVGEVGGGLLCDEVNYLTESVERLGGLTVEGDGACEVEFAMGIVEVFDDDGMTVGLADESDDFGMAWLAVDDDLCVGMGCVFGTDASL